MPDWDEDSPRLRTNLAAVLDAVEAHAQHRERLTLDTLKSWHLRMMEGLQNKHHFPYGRFRGETGLEKVDVRIGHDFGVDAGLVNQAVKEFEATLLDHIDRLDLQWPHDREPTDAMVSDLLDVCAMVHTEWIRIHPFPNGNGRTARLLVNYLCLRYLGFLLIRLRPRPASPYADLAAAAMAGNWVPTAEYFAELYAQNISGYRPET